MSRVAMASDHQGGDLLWQIECELTDTRRVRGAMRAVQCLVQPERLSEPNELQCLQREDLAQLLEVLHCDLADRLDHLDELVHGLRGSVCVSSGPPATKACRSA